MIVDGDSGEQPGKKSRGDEGLASCSMYSTGRRHITERKRAMTQHLKITQQPPIPMQRGHDSRIGSRLGTSEKLVGVLVGQPYWKTLMHLSHGKGEKTYENDDLIVDFDRSSSFTGC